MGHDEGGGGEWLGERWCVGHDEGGGEEWLEERWCVGHDEGGGVVVWGRMVGGEMVRGG